MSHIHDCNNQGMQAYGFDRPGGIPARHLPQGSNLMRHCPKSQIMYGGLPEFFLLTGHPASDLGPVEGCLQAPKGCGEGHLHHAGGDVQRAPAILLECGLQSHPELPGRHVGGRLGAAGSAVWCSCSTWERLLDKLQELRANREQW